MTRKEKVEVQRDEDFAEMDEALNEALAGLQESNTRVEDILNRVEETGEDEAADEDSPEPEDAEQDEGAPPESAPE